jgi:hypothetical protein
MIPDIDLKNDHSSGLPITEIWLPINGYGIAYEVSNYGRVLSNLRSTTSGPLILKPFIDHNGYEIVSLRKEGKYFKTRVNRLVADHFVPERCGPVVNHIDGLKRNNFYLNLEWTTQINNVRHAYLSNLINHAGENNSKSKFTWRQVQIIREAIAAGHLQKDIAIYFNVGHTTICSINTRATWKNPPFIY